MICRDARELLIHRSAGVLDAGTATSLRDHLAGCEPCARRAEIEDGFERGLRRRLRRAAAPAGLDARIRAGLRTASPASSRTAPPWSGVLAAAAALALLLSPAVVLRDGVARGVVFDRVVTVVDLQCDRKGVPPELQRHCRHRGHVNALRRDVGDGYLSIRLDGAAGRRLRADPAVRGERVRVEGRLDRDGERVLVERVTPAPPGPSAALAGAAAAAAAAG